MQGGSKASGGGGGQATFVGEKMMDNKAEDGLIPRSCSRIFEECRLRRIDGYSHVVKICYLELYRKFVCWCCFYTSIVF